MSIENVLVGTHIRTGYGLFDSTFRTKRFRAEEDAKVLKALEILQILGLEGKKDDYAGDLPYGDHRDLHSFPTRRSSDLVSLRVLFRAKTLRPESRIK